MPPIKPEHVEIPPDTKPQIVEQPPYNTIQSEPPTEYPPNFKSEPVDYSSDIPSSKRLKTLTPNSPSPSSKGKSKIMKQEDDVDDYVDASSQQQVDTCGVCLLDQGMSIRGYIDSCQHYFCFVCIMEWAKVESRCPICKGRFSTIRRPSKDDVFLSERIVNVPVRNQVHYYNGNATLGPPDPYSQVKCGICSHSSDDELLLLCDLCDSAAHSYCVGLGATIPEGDWFCKDCAISRDEHAKVETDFASTNNINDNNNNNNNSNNNNNNNNNNAIRFAQSDVSIHDIVRETNICIRELDSSSSVDESVSQSEPIAEQLNIRSTVNAPNARALQRRANVHARIRVLRENWDGFRGGSLNFAYQKNSNSNVSSEKGPYNIDKAWKMMDIATRTIGKKSEIRRSVNKGSKLPIQKDRFVNEGCQVRPDKSYLLELKKDYGIGTSKNNDEKHRFQTFEKNKVTQGYNVKSNQSRVECRLPTEMKNNSYNCQKLLRKDYLGVPTNVVGSSDHSSSSLIATDKCCLKKEMVPMFIENRSIKKDAPSDSNIREVENAKTEIQSLVKLNLKLLSKDKKLEVDVFKEVARHATHSIMAACGIEPPKARFRSFERLLCDHSQTEKRPRSTLMPTSCRECFFVFVKDVVATLVFDTTSSCKV